MLTFEHMIYRGDDFALCRITQFRDDVSDFSNQDTGPIVPLGVSHEMYVKYEGNIPSKAFGAKPDRVASVVTALKTWASILFNQLARLDVPEKYRSQHDVTNTGFIMFHILTNKIV